MENSEAASLLGTSTQYFEQALTAKNGGHIKQMTKINIKKNEFPHGRKKKMIKTFLESITLIGMDKELCISKRVSP